ncbi:type II toxin-antitoxin system toxin DNA ADP-ribosyl transferase DarT [Candidatus Nitrospira inopinata]|jgi:hypothetical protein|uniref:DarT domain-containing protein n=1 Tax=Candidatus Nitrospira inopinata TaxID=1715989 RepID=A0A0S4KU33_9BACT|nr:DUF4433 domain-containing protein [Candidatus Nitrospira inopinata]CUQ65942.1 conserved protein of unknown function [Candidatus Nitrospira inopinata]
MSTPPSRPKIYHITHVDNLPGIVRCGGLLSDRAMLTSGGPIQTIGMSGIKRRRLEELEVHCHTGTKVGEYVPFYFCPRSVMLYVIHRANHLELIYCGGQEPIVHLEADLHTVVQWADTNGVRWAFSLSNAGAYYTEFYATVGNLGDLDWNAIASRDFRDSDIKERKQAEFLLYEKFPFTLVERVGVRSAAIHLRATTALAGLNPPPSVEVRPEWYF